MRSRVGVGGGDRLDDRRRRRLVRVAHAEVDEVGAARPGVGLELVEPGEDVGRQVGQPAGRNQSRRIGGRRLFIGAVVRRGAVLVMERVEIDM